MNDNAPLVTVVMVAYNHAKYLRETMASVFAQTMGDFEVILIDNGSTDDSQQIIATLQDPRLKVITQENLGLSLAYNIGIEAARGKWIALGNADDVWMPQKFELQIKALEATGAGAAFSAAQLIDDNGEAVPEEIAVQFPFSFDNLSREEFYEKFFFKTNFMCATSALLSTELMAKVKFDPALIQLQDFDVWVKLIKQTSFVVLPEKLVAYRVRCDGMNLSLDTRNRSRVLFELHSAYKKFFDDVEPEFFRKALGKHFRKPDQSNPVGLEFEKAFLFLKMQEPSIRALGLEMLYELLSSEAGREVAGRDYDLKIADIWDLSKMPIYADSQALDGSALETEQLLRKIKETESELSSLRESMRQITSGKLWKLREKVYGILKK